MRAMQLAKPGTPLALVECRTPVPGPDQVLVKVSACGVCRTDLHLVDGELPDPMLPIIPGHEAVGTIAEVGQNVTDLIPGQRVGVPWLGHTCHQCWYCSHGKENLCDNAKFHGYTLNGGFAEFMAVDAAYALPLPEMFDDVSSAPLLCAGLIGFRAWNMVRKAQSVGLYGFGAAAHIVIQLALAAGQEVSAFTREGDVEGQSFALQMGAEWAGSSDQRPPRPLDAAIIFAPVGALIPRALEAIRKGGSVIAAGIHMSDIPQFPYALLWGERAVRSVANLTREDGIQFLKLAESIPVKTETTAYPLEKGNEALDDLRHGRIKGAAVLLMAS